MSDTRKGTYTPDSPMRLWLKDVFVPIFNIVLSVLLGAGAIDITFNHAAITTTIINNFIGDVNIEPPTEGFFIANDDVRQQDENSTETPQEVVEEPDDILGGNRASFESRDVVIVEDFEEVGAFSTDYQWYLESECDTSPGESSLVFANAQSSEDLFCNLALSADNLPWGQIGSIEAVLRINHYNNTEMNHGISLYTSDLESVSDWFITCGINAEPNQIEAVFTGINFANGLPNSFFDNELDNAAANVVNIEFETYYTFLLDINYETNIISCFVDGMLIGALDVSAVDGLTDAQIARSISSYRASGSEGETELDLVRILE
ncbi:MAG: hypothetical protein ACFE0Q_01135 [Anaerolineae bacterium]